MSERHLEPAREHQLAEALQAHPEASAGSFQAAIRRRESPIERQEPWAKGCLWASAQSAVATPNGVGISGSKVQVGKLICVLQRKRTRAGSRRRTRKRTLVCTRQVMHTTSTRRETIETVVSRLLTVTSMNTV